MRIFDNIRGLDDKMIIFFYNFIIVVIFYESIEKQCKNLTITNLQYSRK